MPDKRRLVTSNICFGSEIAGLLESFPYTGLRKGNSSSQKCLGRTLCGIDTLVYTLHENMKVNFFGTCPT